jgi:hypothetical protein
VRSGNRPFEEAVRGIGGVLLAVGAVLILARKGGHGWTSLELTLVTAVPCLAMFGVAVLGAGGHAKEPPEPWRALLLIASILLAPVALFLFLHWAGASSRHLLYDAGVLVVTALLAIAGAMRTRAPYAVLLAGIALLGAWLLVWVKLLGGHPSAGTFRWLLLGGGVVLLGAGATLGLADRRGAAELATAGGIGAVGAGLVGVLVGAFSVSLGALGSLTGSSGTGDTVESSSSSGASIPTRLHLPHLHISGTQTFWWDLLLLAISVALVWISVRSRNRGLGYVGGAGLLFFLGSTGAQLTRLEAGHQPSHSLLGWPLALVLVGLAGLAAPSLRTVRRR